MLDDESMEAMGVPHAWGDEPQVVGLNAIDNTCSPRVWG